MLKSFLFNIEDHRRAQGKRYDLGHILLFSILAILSNANSYRKIEIFIKVHYEFLKKKFNLKWKRAPAYTTIRNIIKDVSSSEIEKSFREYSFLLSSDDAQRRFMCIDGKVLRGSFDNFQDQKAIQILSVFLVNNNIILAHEEIEEKTNEIPIAQYLIEKLDLSNCIFTLDALHCQKNSRNI